MVSTFGNRLLRQDCCKSSKDLLSIITINLHIECNSWILEVNIPLIFSIGKVIFNNNLTLRDRYTLLWTLRLSMEYAFIEAISLHYFNLYFKESCLTVIFPGVNYITHDTVKINSTNKSRGEQIAPKFSAENTHSHVTPHSQLLQYL